ncbi:hypothetical protein CFOL_v3_20483 [Cephalotus follicularis]|uniref:Uncharacterized protein n=1 Tax=Cephalotus follicularis TaxID=3775 RepID=A0A1Q3CAA3_CEPFO|nr:hypothetical protein CFOL_v3_20483 [Cephalotus follicularis]
MLFDSVKQFRQAITKYYVSRRVEISMPIIDSKRVQLPSGICPLLTCFDGSAFGSPALAEFTLRFTIKRIRPRITFLAVFTPWVHLLDGILPLWFTCLGPFIYFLSYSHFIPLSCPRGTSMHGTFLCTKPTSKNACMVHAG